MGRRRVAITGVGVLATCGVGREAFWNGLLAPQGTGERRVADFDPLAFFENPKEAKRTDRFTQLGLAAAHEALTQSGDLSADPSRIGVLMGTGIGGIASTEDQIIVMHDKGQRRVTPFLIPMMMSNAGAAALSMKYGFQGPCETTVTACAASNHAIGNAFRAVADGRCDAVLTGGSEAAMVDIGIAGFRNMQALSPSGRSQPFGADRDGFVMTEGAAVLVLEAWDLAEARGATILAELSGAASTADAHHITAPAPGGSGAVNCMEQALADAGVSPADVRQINAHGTSTSLNDAAEAEAIAKVFGAPGPPVTSTKGVTGHGLGAAGALEAVAVVLSIQHRLIPPTDGTDAVDPALPQIDLVTGAPRPWEPGPTLSNSFGFGGHNGCVVIGPA
jgi:3-oxoacyl-[acyl-carrier-protein] synthase II